MSMPSLNLWPQMRSLYCEQVLLFLIVSLLLFGWVAVTSASMEVALNYNFEALHYFKRHLAFMVVGVLGALLMLRIPLAFWELRGWILLPVTLFLLLLVLIPGVGYEVNGAQRWIRLGPVNFQISELAKITYLIYLAGYLVRHQASVQQSWSGFMKPLILLFGIVVLILAQPDFGGVLVLVAATMGVIFLSGVRLSQLILVGAVVLFLGSLLIVFEPYRWQRILAFRDPWADPYNGSYQLTQSLIALGRGDWFGIGLGGSLQKLLYLPEAHTDFIFAVICEELGVIGGIFLGGVFAALVATLFRVGRTAETLGKFFGAYLSYGVGMLIGMQFLINIGVNTGLLPTKGLTLPLISYGGSSLVFTMIALGLVYRVQIENRQAMGWPKKKGF